MQRGQVSGELLLYVSMTMASHLLVVAEDSHELHARPVDIPNTGSVVRGWGGADRLVLGGSGVAAAAAADPLDAVRRVAGWCVCCAYAFVWSRTSSSVDVHEVEVVDAVAAGAHVVAVEVQADNRGGSELQSLLQLHRIMHPPEHPPLDLELRSIPLQGGQKHRPSYRTDSSFLVVEV